MRNIFILTLVTLMVLTGCSGGSGDSTRSEKPLVRTPVEYPSPASGETSTPTPTPPVVSQFSAVINSITPNPAHIRDTVTFSGEGIDPAGDIQAYKWSIEGQGAIAYKESFVSSTITEKTGMYTVIFEVQGSDGVWSLPVKQTLVVAPWPPSASFSATPVFGKVPMAVSFSDSSNKTIDSWLWDFGDGETSTIQNPLHTYVFPGTYTVSLTVTGPEGSDTEVKKGFIEAIDLNFVAIPSAGFNPLEVKFTAESASSIADWSWDFGDGYTSTEQNPAHRYVAAGNYTVKLTVGDGSGRTIIETKPNYIKVLEPTPEADFYCHESAYVNIPENFTDLSEGAITSWSWDFGDGSTSALQHPAHSYASAGAYTVRLIVRGPGGSDFAQRTIVVEAR